MTQNEQIEQIDPKTQTSINKWLFDGTGSFILCHCVFLNFKLKNWHTLADKVNWKGYIKESPF